MTTLPYDQDQIAARIIQEYVPGRQVTIAHIIANPDEELCRRVGLDEAEAIGMLTLTPGESTIIAGDLALKAAMAVALLAPYRALLPHLQTWAPAR